jgi:hypothetical protein
VIWTAWLTPAGNWFFPRTKTNPGFHHRLRVRRASQEFRGLGKKVPALSWLEVASVWVEIDPRLGKMPEDIL